MARIGRRGTLVIPVEIRRRAGLRKGDEVLIDAGQGGVIYVMKRPDDFVGALRGLYPEVWRGVDPVTYVKEERDAWEKSPGSPGGRR